MAELKAPLTRLVKIHGIEGMTAVTINPEGISFKCKGSPTAVTQRWKAVIEACETPHTVKSFLMHKPWELLTSIATKLAIKRAEKAKEKSEN